MADRLIKLERDFTFTKAINDDGVFEGYASVFDTEDHHGDTVKKGAFMAGLKKLAKEKRKIKMLFNHDRFLPLGVFKEADEDAQGLYVLGKLTLGVQKADETRLLMKDEAIDSMSIGGYVRKELVDQKTWKRDLLEIELKEISPVVFPALDAARIVSVKSIEGMDLAKLEAHLRDVGGFSYKEAKAIISCAKSATSQRDVDEGSAELKKALLELRSVIQP